MARISHPLILSLLGLAVAFPCGAADEAIDFNRDIRPILSNKCIACHGPDEEERKADLRLDTREGALFDLGGYAAVVPGDINASELIHRVTIDDEDEIMPPPDKGDPLNADEVALLRQWIAQGAEYAIHWSYAAPVKAVAPPVKNATWPMNAIDRFLLARMEKENLKPTPDADRRTLARRASLDLTGLPPSWGEVRAFEEDTAPGAYERFVDAMLAKPSFGEHWARLWLDQARYADSSGYPSDQAREIWGYRDWVIDAFNRNHPFDRFTIDQLAGDLHPEPTDAQLIATAFHRNTMTQNEGGTSDEEFRTAAIVDRVNTTMEVWMGTTMACAQCHTHKFDPITQAEYFQVFAILNQSADSDRKDEAPILDIFNAEQKRQKAAWQSELARTEAELEKVTPELRAELATWEKQFRTDPAWTQLVPVNARSQSKRELRIARDGTLTASGAKPKKDRYTIDLRRDEKTTPWTGLRVDTLPGESNFVLSQITARFEPASHTPLRGRYVRVELPGKEKMLSLAEVQVFHGSTNLAENGQASQSSTAFNGPATLAIDGITDGDYRAAKSTTHTERSTDPWWEVDLGASRDIDRIAAWNRSDAPDIGERLAGYVVKILDDERNVVWERRPAGVPDPSSEFSLSGARTLAIATAAADFSQKGLPAASVLTAKIDPAKGWGIAPRTGESHRLELVFAGEPVSGPGVLTLTVAQQSKFENHVLEAFRLSATDAAHLSQYVALPEDTRRVLAKLPAERDARDNEILLTHFRQTAPSRAPHRKRLATLEKQLKAMKPVTTVPVMRELEGEARRKTFIQRRGNWLDLGDEVSPGVPSAFHSLAGSGTPDRLALGRWLVDRKNPLTARVTVNRLWEAVFGIGIVSTGEEFGSQGELPLHPELLDWLAVDFMEHGWDVKRLLKQFVVSRAYRQDSRSTPEMNERDPDNRFLARGPRFRPTGEQLRDQALSVSGLLSEKIGGPAVRPMAPNLGLKTAFGRANDWKTSEGEDRHRRSVYTEIRRNAPYASFATFDAPNREVCTSRRNRTNTPLQAFVTLNDPVFIEANQALARRLVKAVPEGDVAARLRHAFHLCLSRAPRPDELETLATLFEETHRTLTADKEAAAELATNPLGPAPEGADLVELAAWTATANVIMNLDEFLMRR